MYFFEKNNRFSQSYLLIYEIEALETIIATLKGEEVFSALWRDHQSNQQWLNVPTSIKVVMIVVNEDG